MKIYYPLICCPWEIDYFKMLFQGKTLIYYEKLEFIKEHVDILITNSTFGSFDNAKIIIFLSEEDHAKNYMNATFVQYRHNDMYQIPLGFCAGMEIPETIKKSSERKIDFSFIGSLKNNRKEMIDVFKKHFPNHFVNVGFNSWKIDSQKVTPKQMAKIYSDTKFVPIGRGNISLDCFRIYEAIVCGAIPVIVGEQKEIDHVFYYNGDPLPVIFAQTWEDAAQRCKEIDFDQTQQICMDWFERQNKTILRLIDLQ